MIQDKDLISYGQSEEKNNLKHRVD